MIITSSADFGSVAGSPQGWVPVRRFANLLHHGLGTAPSSRNVPPKGNSWGNEAFPNAGKRNSQNAAVWGHWINYVDSAGDRQQPTLSAEQRPTNQLRPPY